MSGTALVPYMNIPKLRLPLPLLCTGIGIFLNNAEICCIQYTGTRTGMVPYRYGTVPVWYRTGMVPYRYGTVPVPNSSQKQ
jgi:hypothetical protein